MNIAIVGSGHTGANVGTLLARKGHKLYFSFSHDQQKLERLATEAGNGSKAASVYDAVMCSEVILFSPPWTQVDRALAGADEIKRKIVIDTTNPYGADMSVQTFDEDDSSSEHIARKMPHASVVKAFNTLPAQTLLDKSGQGIVLFYSGDDPIAKQTVASLIEECGFVPVNAGTLHDGRHQEPNTARYNREMRKDEADRLIAAGG